MFTNTYFPHVGGVSHSVGLYAAELRKRGHTVLVVAPEFENTPEVETDVVRVPAIQNFNGTDFSVTLPFPVILNSKIRNFTPDIIHSHHPFLLGETALRAAAHWNVPIVFTHHTMYERYTHYVPGDSPPLKRFAIELSTGYANLCDHVIAPSESITHVLKERGVTTPITALPTGVDYEKFKKGDGAQCRKKLNIPADAFVVGHVGRLAPEKNISFLASVIAKFLHSNPSAHTILVGEGPSQSEFKEAFDRTNVSLRAHIVGTYQNQELIDCYHAMDVFAFASKTETQGMVLVEAMAAGVPAVALDAPGAREIIRDGINGSLLHSEDKKRFVHKLHHIASLSRAGRNQMRSEASATAKSLSIGACSDRLLDVYRSITAQSVGVKEVNDSAWAKAGRLFKTELEILSTQFNAVSTATEPLTFFRAARKMFEYIGKLFRQINRGRWTGHLLGLTPSSESPSHPGLILIQIDGLSFAQFQRGLREGNLKFLKRLKTRHHYTVHTFYSGVPSATPSIQGELFYGVRQAVPSFAFVDRDTGEATSMLSQRTALKTERQIATKGSPLLEGGSSYSNIFGGGADEARFCCTATGFGELFSGVNPLKLIAIILWYLPSFLRAIALVIIEIILALADCIRGLIDRKELFQELIFVPTRVGVSILLRELVVISTAIDIARGVPIIHLNFLGYDEQAHRRGPSSKFAHWSLKGIDHAIQRIVNTAKGKSSRDYEVWVYSDHGQEEVIPYPQLTGEEIGEAIERVCGDHVVLGEKNSEHQRIVLLGSRKEKVTDISTHDLKGQNTVQVAAQGPVGHIYFETKLPFLKRNLLAEKLVREASIPIVLTLDESGNVLAWNRNGCFKLPNDAARVLGPNHPFLKIAANELVSLLSHPNSGDLIILGWRHDAPPISFPIEHGAHGGPGYEELQAFALLPSTTPLVTNESFLRPLDLRQAAFRYMNRIGTPYLPRSRKKDHLRVMTYNIHSCIGNDGKISHERIARVIAQFDPDIVALQELDVRKRRTLQIDQAHAIAHSISMEYQFYPTIQLEEEKYGDAILSRYPLQLIRADSLPTDPRYPSLEPRGAIWVEVKLGEENIQVINTHFGLGYQERKFQVQALLRDEWIPAAKKRGPVILCGDFNALPRSFVCKTLGNALRDVQNCVKGEDRKKTWLSTLPFYSIDHIFLSDEFTVQSVTVPQTLLTRTASDHLPLIADVVLGGKESVEAR